MSNSGLGGYVAPQKRDDVIDLQVLCLNGEGYALKVSGSCMGWEVCRMVSKHLPPRKGGKITLHHGDWELLLNQTLQQQGVLGKPATLSCTYVPTDLYGAWRSIQDEAFRILDTNFSLEGVTLIGGIEKIRCF